MYFKNLPKPTNWPKYKLKILNQAFFKKSVNNFYEITGLSKKEREFLTKNERFTTLSPLKLHHDKKSKTYKMLFGLYDKNKIESVLMQFEDGRNSICVSSQVGCPIGCIFCATGQMGFKRNLTTKEIVDQVLYFARLLKNYKAYISKPTDISLGQIKDLTNVESQQPKVLSSKSTTQNSFHPQTITNVVYMGMGEPMLNYKNVIESIKILTNPNEFGLGARRITISTCGIIKQLYKLMDEKIKIKLAVSLHAPTQKLREKIMPIAKTNSLKNLFKFIDEWQRTNNRRVTYEYILIKDVNDGTAQALELANLLQKRIGHVNLIPMNTISNHPTLQKPNKNSIYRFERILKENNIPVSIRVTMGDRIKAACGQLATK